MGRKRNAATVKLQRIKDSTIRKLLNVSQRLNPYTSGIMLYLFIELNGKVNEWGVIQTFDGRWYSTLEAERVCKDDPKEIAYLTIRDYYEKHGVIIE